MTERMYTIADAAKVIGISYTRLWIKSKEGKIKGLRRFREGNRMFVQIPESSVLELKEKHEKWLRMVNEMEA